MKAKIDPSSGAMLPDKAVRKDGRRASAPVVSSAHLAAGRSPALSEVEFGLNLAAMAYQRWMVRCMAAAGMPGLSPLEVLVLHTVRHRDRPKRFADIMLVLDIEEIHLITYVIRKLTSAGLVTVTRAGKDRLISTSPSGVALCARYHEIREDLLVSAIGAVGPGDAMLSEMAALLRGLSGTYNQAARAATTL
ncbi:winged helix DNA-binding protein [Acidiphilium sp. PA]|uniref:winged helix DNA-binding protein n=1 Tax=Acidiphilium sp. PA TaxID=2871705 RepID=UPI002244850C|nr:winged helix DNA-binding protein [Acidiphilium sp. PA]MCW8308923.1 winged helix DNA-binding protein [Acidiphilium sp. PA]